MTNLYSRTKEEALDIVYKKIPQDWNKQQQKKRQKKEKRKSLIIFLSLFFFCFCLAFTPLSPVWEEK